MKAFQQLKNGLREESDPYEAGRISEAIKTLKNQLRSADDIAAEIEIKAELREENIRRMNEGKNPHYLNQSEQPFNLDYIESFFRAAKV